MVIVTSIFPIADFVQNVGGERVEVITLLPPGASPHVYEPTPEQVKNIARADLFIKNGGGLEFWAEKMVVAAANPDLVVVDTSREIELLKERVDIREPGEDENGEHGGNVNPHFWLDPLLAQRQVEAIRDALVDRDPSNQEFYRQNAANYLKQLEALDREIAEITRSFTTREFVSFHAAWSYLARRYNLVEAAVIEKAPGREPSPALLKEIIDTVRKAKVKAIFAEPQFSPRIAQTIATETGAKVLFIDPIGGPGLKDRDSYISLMRYNVSQMSFAMK
jgi:zinc transport system substrate-binding protein